MKWAIILILFVTTSLVHAQNKKLIFYDSILNKLHTGNIYLVCRGTKSKAGLIAKKFNLSDTSITHVGVGLVVKNKLLIYNMSDTKKSYSGSLVIDSLNSFIYSNEVKYLSIWCLKASSHQIKKMRDVLSSMIQKHYSFDYNFSLDSGDSLYCSEFCATVLNTVFTHRHAIKPMKIKIENQFISAYLKSDTLNYYPADFFMNDNRFKKILEVNGEQIAKFW